MKDERKAMWSAYNAYRGAMAYIEVENTDGSIGIGSAFHVGEGVFVTARHIVEGNRITSIATTERSRIPDPNGKIRIHGQDTTYRSEPPTLLSIDAGPFYHPNKLVDVAAIVCNEKQITTVPLGSHLDDWISNKDFIMRDTLIMGYPSIPFSKGPQLIAATGEINGILDNSYINAPHPRFIISSTPRGGFSGGLCLIEWDFALGVIIESLTYNNKPEESGFMSVITVEPIYECLSHHNILPKIQKDGWNGLWGEGAIGSSAG